MPKPPQISKQVTLFGYYLTHTSALLLFLASLSIVLGCIYGLYIVGSTYNALGYFAIAYFLVIMLLLFFGSYIMYKTSKFRKLNK